MRVEIVRKGISPVIATVIIVAVAVAIAIAVVGWIMGLWGSIAGGTEQLQIYPDSYIVDKTIVLHVVNKGSANAVIYKIEAVSLGTATSGFNATGDISTENATTVVISPGADATINATITSPCTPGAYYLVKVYTKAGNVYQANILCKG